MNKSGQTTFGVVFSVIVFCIVWVMFLAKLISEWGQTYVATNSTTGIEAFFILNINLWIGICMAFGLMMAGLFGGRQ